MRLICTQDNFKKAIFNCERVVSRQNTLPILNNILFSAEKGSLKLSATNLEIGTVAKISAKVEKEGKITLPAKLISNLVNNLPGGDNVILEGMEQALKIKSGLFRATIKGLSSSDFPLIPQKKTEFLISFPGKELKDALQRVIICAAVNEARQELTGVNLILGSDKVFFAATDSFRLAEHRLKLDSKNINEDNLNAYISQKNSVIIPVSTLSELVRIVANEEDDLVKMAIEEGQIFFEIGGTRIVSRLINGKYPQYQHIMPKEYKTRAVGDKNSLAQAVRMASIFASGKSSEISLNIDAGAKKISVGAKSAEVGENSTELNFDITGPSQEAIFNSRYLLDGINTIATSQLAISLNRESSPAAIREIDEKTGEVLEDYTHIIMPIKN